MSGVPRRLAVVLLAVLALAAPAAAGRIDYVIHGDRSFGGLGFRDTLASAKAVLGAPDRVARHDSSCVASWRGHGLSIEFFAFAPDDPCTRGTVLAATMTGTRWRTLSGLRVGDPVAVVRARHPHATRHADGWWLVTRKGCELGGSAPFGALIARVAGGRVAAFVFQGFVCE